MARRKNQPEAVQTKCHLSERLRQIRTELYGERGGSEMARRLGVPIRTWYNYESGVTVPAEILLRFMELTGVEPQWLLHGRGNKFRVPPPADAESADPAATVESLLRSALKHLELRAQRQSASTLSGPRPPAAPATLGPSRRDGNGTYPHGDSPEGRPTSPVEAQIAWRIAQQEGRCLRVSGNAMAPLVCDGALVIFSGEDEPPAQLDGSLVVAWVDGQPLVRWFRLSGSYGLLRAENPDHGSSIQLVDLSDPDSEYRIRRVLWTSTPH